MKFFSFVKEDFFFTPVEVQVSLQPGLPEVKFTGLVDMAIKESSTRLKSAFRSLGFDWPSRRQIIVNLSPAYIKKKSPGVDLALAAAILWKTKQLDFSDYGSEEIYFYGEVDLRGQASAPEDWKTLPSQGKTLVIGSLKEKNYKQKLYSVKSLKDLAKGRKIPVEDWRSRLKAPEPPEIYFSKKAGGLLKAAAAGEHSLLLCGAAGSGKTTLAEQLFYLLPPPERKAFEEQELLSGAAPAWRSFINPHHTTPPLSMIGGGSPLFLGEISKAHGGMLLMDEYLEFHPKVQEALREPLEKGEIHLARRGLRAVFPARFILAAASNLCPCGDYEPQKPVRCAYSLRRCQSYLDRLSGPMMDRFDLLAFSKDWSGEKSLSLKSLQQEAHRAFLFRKELRNQNIPNAQLSLQELEAGLPQKIKRLLPQSSSQRRKRALLRTARTFSDLKEEKEISPASIEQALGLAVKNFFFLKNRILN